MRRDYDFANSAPQPWSAKTVLVVEDEPSIRQVIAAILEHAGYRVVLANDGNEALERFRENEVIDVVLSDVVMPGMNGVELVALLKQSRPSLRAVLMSGYSEPSQMQASIASGWTWYLRKPFGSAELLRQVSEVAFCTAPTPGSSSMVEM